MNRILFAGKVFFTVLLFPVVPLSDKGVMDINPATGSNSGKSGSGVLQTSKCAGKVTVHNIGDLPAVPDLTYYPEANPGTQRATGSVYAKPSSGLRAFNRNLPLPVHAISGVKGQRLDSDVRVHNPKSKEKNPYAETVDIVVYLGTGDYFTKNIREGYDTTTWIRNLPDGLRVRAHSVKAGQESRYISFYITGIPKTAQRSEINVAIPKEYLSGNREKVFISSTEELDYTTEQTNTAQSSAQVQEQIDTAQSPDLVQKQSYEQAPEENPTTTV